MNIYDIAKKANVSIATISRVMHDSPKVSAKTKEKILKIIEECNYVPNVIAQNLSNRDSLRNIGIVCYNLEDVYYAKAVSLLEAQLRAYGYNIILACTGTDLYQKQKSIELLVSKQVDAIILIGSVFVGEHDNEYLKKTAERLPLMIINGKIEDKNIYSFYCDDRLGVKENVKLLSRLTHDIIYIYDAETYSGNMKLSGFLKGMEEIGINGRSKALICGPSPLSAAEAFKKYLKEGFKARAVITANDILAAGVINAAHSLGIKIPDELAVIGYNNSVICECTSPALTSINNGIEFLCKSATDKLTDIFDGKKTENMTVFIPKLIMRKSFTY